MPYRLPVDSRKPTLPVWWRRYGLALLAVVAAFLINLAIAPVLGHRGLFLVPMAAVVVAAAFGGIGPGLLTTTLLLLAIWSIQLAPSWDWHFGEPGDAVWLILFAAIGLLVSLLGDRLLRARHYYRAALQDREKRLAELDSLFETASVGLVLLDRDLRFTRVNQAIAQMDGIPAAAYIGHTVFEIVPQMPAALLERFRLVLETGQPIAPMEVTIDMPPPQGRRHWLVSVQPIRSRQGVIFGNAGVRVDITDMRRAQAAQAASERRLQAILTMLPVGVMLTDQSGRIIECNAAARLIWGGFTPLEAMDAGRLKGWRVDNGAALAEQDWALRRALVHGEVTTGALVDIECHDGSHKTILDSAAPLRDREGRLLGVVMVHQDVTALRRAEAAARQAASDREDLLAIVSHDLKSPLTAILLNADLIRHKAPEVAKQADGIRRSGDTMLHLLEDLLDANRVRSGHLALCPEPMPVRSLINEAVEALKPQAAAKSLRIISDVPCDLPDIPADRRRVMQVLTNLLGNAVKFTPERGAVTVRAEVRGACLRIGVQDTGPGVPADQQQQIFERFWQGRKAERQGVGSGLGLAIAKGIVEAHGGHIWVASEEGHGALFAFTLPLAGPPAAQRAA